MLDHQPASQVEGHTEVGGFKGSFDLLDRVSEVFGATSLTGIPRDRGRLARYNIRVSKTTDDS
jgi:hypothetical protein